MFTGIIEDIGTIKSASLRRLAVVTRLDGIADGDSVAVDGVCLTATSVAGGAVTFDVSPETLSRTTLGELRAGARVNIERAARPDGRLGGHIVQGHVDNIGRVASLRREGNSLLATFGAPVEYIVEKGSVAVNGISLTVAALDGKRGRFTAAIVPHTLEMTTFKNLRAGMNVNIEYDIAAKYLDKYAAKYAAPSSQKLTREKLKNAGF